MASLNLSEKALIFDYIFLTDLILDVLDDISSGKKISLKEQEILKRGSELLSRIIEGTTLLEQKQFKNGLSPSVEGLTICGYALTTFDELKVLKEEGLTEFFEKINSSVLKITRTLKPDQKTLRRLMQFFSILGNSFRSDIQDDTVIESLKSPVSCNTQSLSNV